MAVSYAKDEFSGFFLKISEGAFRMLGDLRIVGIAVHVGEVGPNMVEGRTDDKSLSYSNENDLPQNNNT